MLLRLAGLVVFGICGGWWMLFWWFGSWFGECDVLRF